jgi:hypothetical protein
MTANTNDIKMDIINIISKIDDVDRLERIYKNIERDDFESTPKPNIQDAIVEITEGLTYKQILEEQNYKPITYNEFRALADQIEWEHSLEELLAELD